VAEGGKKDIEEENNLEGKKRDIPEGGETKYAKGKTESYQGRMPSITIMGDSKSSGKNKSLEEKAQRLGRAALIKSWHRVVDAVLLFGKRSRVFKQPKGKTHGLEREGKIRKRRELEEETARKNSGCVLQIGKLSVRAGREEGKKRKAPRAKKSLRMSRRAPVKQIFDRSKGIIHPCKEAKCLKGHGKGEASNAGGGREVTRIWRSRARRKRKGILLQKESHHVLETGV